MKNLFKWERGNKYTKLDRVGAGKTDTQYYFVGRRMS